MLTKSRQHSDVVILTPNTCKQTYVFWKSPGPSRSQNTANTHPHARITKIEEHSRYGERLRGCAPPTATRAWVATSQLYVTPVVAVGGLVRIQTNSSRTQPSHQWNPNNKVLEKRFCRHLHDRQALALAHTHTSCLTSSTAVLSKFSNSVRCCNSAAYEDRTFNKHKNKSRVDLAVSYARSCKHNEHWSRCCW